MGERRGVSSSTMVTVMRESTQDEEERKGSGLKQASLSRQSLRSLSINIESSIDKAQTALS